ncbi:MAG: hypothetical protein RI897_71 [Verrucomicrobiota bacterium]
MPVGFWGWRVRLMRFLTDSAAVLSEWRVFADAGRHCIPMRSREERVWRALAGEDQPWEVFARDMGLPEELGVMVSYSAVSQFDAIHELILEGVELPRCLVAVALEGSNFHGQGGRPWVALAGNLHLTVFFQVDMDASDTLGAIPVLPTLAVMDAFGIQADPSERTGIRWVNDVFVRGRKLAGSIAVSEVEGSRLEGLLFGIGANVETIPEVPGNVFVPQATSLRQIFPQAEWTVEHALFALLRGLVNWVERLGAGGAALLVREYARRSACIGREVKIWSKQTRDVSREQPIACGALEGIGPDLSLKLEGCEDVVMEGRLAFAEDCRRFGV